MQLIKNTSYRDLCDYVYDPAMGLSELPPNGTSVFLPLDWSADFFRRIEGTPNRYVVVSGNSDYCLCYQNEHPINRDMLKWWEFCKQDFLNAPEYSDLLIPSRCRKEYCKITDRFSIKCYSYTKDTFSHIPANVVHWFVVNSDVDEENVSSLPFGVPDWSYNPIQQATSRERMNKVYVCFSRNTLERSKIISIIKQQHPPNFVYDEDVTHEQYIEALKTYKYVLAMPGNGFSTFRSSESLYCGAIPLHPTYRFNEVFADYGLYFNSLEDLFSMNFVKMESNKPPIKYLEDFTTLLEEKKKLLC